MAFLHGAKTTQADSAVRPILTPPTAVIGLVGIAPIGPKQTLTLVSSETDAAQFGGLVNGFSIPQTLAAINAEGGARVIVVNVFDAATMTAAVSAESHTIANRKFKLNDAHVGDASDLVVKTSGGSPVTLNQGTDYSFDQYGVVTILNASYANGTTLVADYTKLDASAVTAAVIVGAIDGVTGARTGMKLFDQALSTFGYNPKVMIAPYFSQLSTVQPELIAKAGAYDGIALLDFTEGGTPSNVIAARAAGELLATTSERAAIGWPWLKYLSPDTESNEPLPFSSSWAGVISRTDSQNGYQFSPSNKPLSGFVTGVEYKLQGAGISDENADWNLLNAAGITTIYESFGAGTRVWGNRTAAYPSETAPAKSFISVMRARSIIDEAIRNSMLSFIDQPINQAFIDAVRESVNLFLRKLVGDGTIVAGECTYLASDNPPADLANGIVKFRTTYLPPSPAERIEFISVIDTNLLALS